MRQGHVSINGKTYAQGAVFVIKSHDGIACIERRMIFMFYDTVQKKYWFITPNRATNEAVTIYPDTRFMQFLIRTEDMTCKEKTILQNKLKRMNAPIYL